MAQKPSIPKGTRDFGQEEMAARNYIFDTIRSVYRTYGYVQIETPAMENLSTLLGKYGDEGDKLLFKVLNSGDAFKGIDIDNYKDEDGSIDSNKLAMSVCEKGLRYDLTVPFARYVVQHQNEIAFPFRRFQIQPVWRADRPQKGRYREFYQCDADVIGSKSQLNELELVQIVDTVFTKFGINVAIKINNRKVLTGLAEICGYPDKVTDITVAIDKLDKIGLEGVAKELEEEGFAKESIDTYLAMFKEISSDIQGVRYCKEKLADVLDEQIAADLETIISTVEAVKTADFKMAFDPTLVRGMSYYTGPIFEISMDEFGGSVGGGGRYDEMIGKFTGNNTSACGFSIGFERIVMLLLERGYQIPTAKAKKAYLIEKNMPSDKLIEIFRQAEEERKTGVQVNISIMKKNKKFQKDQMTAEGYTEFVEFFKR